MAEVVRLYRGPIIDRDIFAKANGLASLPERFSTSVPHFEVIRDREPMGPRWRFIWDFEREGWVWDGKVI